MAFTLILVGRRPCQMSPSFLGLRASRPSADRMTYGEAVYNHSPPDQPRRMNLCISARLSLAHSGSILEVGA